MGLVNFAHNSCIANGCKFTTACEIHDDAVHIRRKAEGLIKEAGMKYALWCDHGEHAFSPNDRHHTLTVREYDEDGDLHQEDKTVCHEHMQVVQKSLMPPADRIPTQDN